MLRDATVTMALFDFEELDGNSQKYKKFSDLVFECFTSSCRPKAVPGLTPTDGFGDFAWLEKNLHVDVDRLIKIAMDFSRLKERLGVDDLSDFTIVKKEKQPNDARKPL
jgi:hypothetical protein